MRPSSPPASRLRHRLLGSAVILLAAAAETSMAEEVIRTNRTWLAEVVQPLETLVPQEARPQQPAPPVPATQAPPTNPTTPTTAPSPATTGTPFFTTREGVVLSQGRLNPTGRDIPLTAPLRENGFILGEIDFVLTADDRIRVNASRLAELLRPLLSGEGLLALETAIAGRGQILAEDLTPLGYQIGYDPQTISLRVDLPAGVRPIQDFRLAGRDDARIGRFVEPARFSAYLNARGAFDYVHQGSQDTGFTDPLVLLDGAARFRGVVFESEGSYQGGDDSSFRREGSRFVYDDLDRTARYTLGDLRPVSRGFAGGAPVSGVSVLRSYSVLEPTRNVQPVGNQVFSLVRPSTVEAFINGRSVRQVRLQPGTYNLQDIPFTQGANDVRLVITDDAGGQDVVEFSQFFDRTLLEPGLSEFGASLGVSSRFAQGSREYDADLPIFLGFYRRGLNERFTLGANANIQKDGAVLGAEGVWASPIGTLGADLAVSDVDRAGSGYAFNMSFQRVFAAESGAGRSVSFAVETRSEEFSVPGIYDFDFVPHPYEYEVSAGYSQSLGETQFIALDVRHAAGRALNPDFDTVRALYGWTINSRTNLVAEASYENRFGQSEYGLRVGLTYRLGDRSNLRAEVDTRSEGVRLGYDTSRGEGVGSLSASLDAQISQDVVGLNASLAQTRNRFDAAIAHLTSYDIDGSSISDQRTSLRAAGAVVYADGVWGLSRPVFDGFAVVAPHESLRGRTILIDPREGYYSSTSDLFGPPVEPSLTAFSERTFTYDVPDAPAGYDLGSGTVRTFAPYRAGYLVVVGSDYSVTAVGRLIDREGQPISLLAGEAFEIAEPDRPAVVLFTNRTGRFGAQGLRPGRWRVVMPTPTPTVYEFTVVEGTEGLVQLGELRPEPVP